MGNNWFVGAAKSINAYSKEVATAAGGVALGVWGATSAYSKIENIVQATSDSQANGEMVMQTIYAAIGVVGCGLVMKAYKGIREGMVERDEMLLEAQRNMEAYRNPDKSDVTRRPRKPKLRIVSDDSLDNIA